MRLLSCIVLVLIWVKGLGQDNLHVKFSQKISENHSDVIKLKVENSSKKLYYYTIGVSVRTDTGWKGLTADINSFGKNEFIFLKPIRPREIIIKKVTKKTIIKSYKSYNLKEIKFTLMYFEKQDFNSNRNEINLLPVKM